MKRIFLLLSCAVLFLTACQPTKSEKTVKKIQITSTTTMVTNLVENIGGKYVAVTGLMGPGVDPHLYKASQGDIAKLGNADMIFYNGVHLEGKMTGIFEKMKKKKPVVAVAGKISENQLLSIEEQHDPHIWFDVSLWIRAAEQVRDSLIEYDPSHKNEFNTQAADYIQKLKELHSYVDNKIKSIPKERRVLVTAHDAFGYFGKAYGMEVVGLQGISTVSEYGLKDVEKIVNLLCDRKIKAVFIESSVPKRSIEAVVQGAGKKNHTVSIGGELFSDAMGPKDTEEGTYIGMVKHNVDTIVNALK